MDDKTHLSMEYLVGIQSGGGETKSPLKCSQAPSADNDIANKAYVDNAIKTALLTAFPVGTILETTNSDNPSTYIGGTWEQLGAGLTTITAGTYKETHNGTTDTYVFTAGKSNFTRNGVSMSGEAEHIITEGEMAHITGSVGNLARQDVDYDILTSGVFSSPHSIEYVSNGVDATPNSPDGFDLNFGKDQPHNNIAPIYGVYRFRRVK